MTDDAIQQEVEGGDHRFPFLLDRRGRSRVGRRPRPRLPPGPAGPGRPAPPPVTAGPPPRTGAARPDPSVVHPLAAELTSGVSAEARIEDIAAVFLWIAVVATFAAAPGRRQGWGAPPGRDWPVALAAADAKASPARTRPGGPPTPCRHRKCNKGSDDRQLRPGRPCTMRGNGNVGEHHRRPEVRRAKRSDSRHHHPRPFHVEVPDAALEDLADASRPPTGPGETVADQSQGVPLAMLEELARYWASDYDWRTCEATLNALPHFITEIDGLVIRFIHVQVAA